MTYPALPPPPGLQEKVGERYMLKTLRETIEVYDALPDVTCQMLTKICKMMAACIQMYHCPQNTDTPWMLYLEGNKGLAYDLSKQPHEKIIY